jgi:hypothetical protein
MLPRRFCAIMWAAINLQVSVASSAETAPGFARSLLLEEKGETSASVSVADLNGDKHLDFVIGDENTKRVVLWSNAGRRTFREGSALTDSAVPYAIAIADVTRDGKPDIILGNQKAPGFVFYQTGGVPAFRSVRWNDGAGAVYGIAVGDLNGDGWPDLIAARSDAPNAIWFGP